MLAELMRRGPDDDGDFEAKRFSGVLGFDTDLSQQERRNGGA